jgi:Methyltransferase domain
MPSSRPASSVPHMRNRSTIAGSVDQHVSGGMAPTGCDGATDDTVFAADVPRVQTTACYIDYLGDGPVLLPGPSVTVTAHPEGSVGVGGWIVDSRSAVASGRVRVLVDERPYAAYYGGERPDVVDALGLPLMRLSGFHADIPAGDIAPGEHSICVELASDGQREVVRSATVSFNLEFDEKRPRSGEERFDLWGRQMPAAGPGGRLPYEAAVLRQGSQAEARRAFATLNDIALRLARNPFFTGSHFHVMYPHTCAIVYAQFNASSLPMEEFRCDVDGFTAYLAQALPIYRAHRYVELYGGEAGMFPEKAFEHYVSYDYLRWAPSDRVMDLACWRSPAGEVLSRCLAPAEYWAHDITLETNHEARTISGFADAIEGPDDFFDIIMAHCAIDNFEGRADVDVFREAARLLKPGGRILVVPLHMAARFENLVALGSPGIEIDEGAHIVLGPPGSLRFGRHYSVEVLMSRIVHQVPELEFRVVHVANPPVDRYPSTCAARFMLVGTKLRPATD